MRRMSLPAYFCRGTVARKKGNSARDAFAARWGLLGRGDRRARGRTLRLPQSRAVGRAPGNAACAGLFLARKFGDFADRRMSSALATARKDISRAPGSDTIRHAPGGRAGD